MCRDSLAHKDPVKMPCGHVICLVCVTNWIERERTCPYCKGDLPDNFKVLSTKFIRYDELNYAQVARTEPESLRKYVCYGQKTTSKTFCRSNGFLCFKARLI